MDGDAMKVRAYLLGLFLLLAGCVAGPGANPSLAADRITSVSAHETLGNTGVTLDPPGVVAAPVDAQKAYNVCTTGQAPCPPTSPTAARLAVATDPGPGTVDGSGKVNLLMSKRLVWAISWSDIECRLRGGPVVDSSAPAADSSGPTSCDTVAFVDAETGEFLYEVTYQH